MKTFCCCIALVVGVLLPFSQAKGPTGMMSYSAFKSIVKSEAFNAGVPVGLGSAGGIHELTKIDYNKTTAEVFKQVGDVVVPLLAAGLSLIPGAGPIIAGVVTVAWTVISSLLGGPEEKSPLDIFAEDVNKKLEHLSERINLISEKFPELVDKKLDERLSNSALKMVHGELSRNKYICSKYSALSHQFSEALQNNQSLPKSLQIEMIALIHDCDNFLKDTVEGFVHPEFADILWAPSVIASMMRVSFLTEVSSWGVALNMSTQGNRLFWLELKDSIKRHFIFSDEAVKKRLSNSRLYDAGDFTSTEYQACRLQKQLLYLDREMYPYGVPKQVSISVFEYELNLTDYNVTGNNQIHHIQVFYDDINSGKQPRSALEATLMLNCIAGISAIPRLPAYSMEFRVTFVPNKIYEIRILYFTIEQKYALYSVPVDSLEIEYVPGGSSNRRVSVCDARKDTYKICIATGEPNTDNAQRFLLKTGIHQMSAAPNRPPRATAYGWSGTYVVESALALNVTSTNLQARITVGKSTYAELMMIFGAELIVYPPRN